VPSALPLQPAVLDRLVTITLPASEPEGPVPQPELNALALRPLLETLSIHFQIGVAPFFTPHLLNLHRGHLQHKRIQSGSGGILM
jgi:hypothetical protein